MTKQEIEKVIRVLLEASEVMTNLDSNFKAKNGCYNLDITLDEIVYELRSELERYSE